MRYEEVELSEMTAEALDDLVCNVGRCNTDMRNMAWLAIVAEYLPDDERFFPMGKWATIQHIQAQLRHSAALKAQECCGRIG